ncbi:MAG: biotin/lipoyl-binding protein, partial [Opitutales bacterium]|nr:biotin/lipoyl-binding protein [Opitutales bacterium]
MATEIKVPALGESITSGIIAAWNVKDGDYVQRDQAIYELETDKITSEGLAEVAGRISLKAAEGDEVEIGQAIAEIDETATAPENSKAETPGKTESICETANSDAVSPAVRHIASEQDLDLQNVDGTGNAGRVTKGDML